MLRAIAWILLSFAFVGTRGMHFRPTRRTLLSSSLALSFPVVCTAEPAPPAPALVCDDQCMQARVARKAELLRKQDRKGKADAKLLFGGSYQAGKREVTSPESKIPVIGEFLLPNDVGGVNLQTAGAPASSASTRVE